MALRFNKDGDAYKPTLEHKRAFTGWSDRAEQRDNPGNDLLFSLYRKFFIQGQADYRAGCAPAPEVEFDERAIEAWNMGWQADAEVEKRGLQLSSLGLITPPPSELEELGALDYDPNL
jgi:hypothetical protein